MAVKLSFFNTNLLQFQSFCLYVVQYIFLLIRVYQIRKHPLYTWQIAFILVKKTINKMAANFTYSRQFCYSCKHVFVLCPIYFFRIFNIFFKTVYLLKSGKSSFISHNGNKQYGSKKHIFNTNLLQYQSKSEKNVVFYQEMYNMITF